MYVLKGITVDSHGDICEWSPDTKGIKIDGIRINSELKAFFFNFMRIYNGKKKHVSKILLMAIWIVRVYFKILGNIHLPKNCKN